MATFFFALVAVKEKGNFSRLQPGILISNPGLGQFGLNIYAKMHSEFFDAFQNLQALHRMRILFLAHLC